MNKRHSRDEQLSLICPIRVHVMICAESLNWWKILKLITIHDPTNSRFMLANEYFIISKMVYVNAQLWGCYLIGIGAVACWQSYFITRSSCWIWFYCSFISILLARLSVFNNNVNAINLYKWYIIKIEIMKLYVI